MKSFKNIIFFHRLGKAERGALERIVPLVENNNARLKIVRVIEDLPRELQAIVRERHSMDMKKIVEGEYAEELNQMIEPLRERGLQVKAKILTGTPFLEVIREVIRNRHDLAVMSEEASSGSRTSFFGSTTMHMMRKCPCPLMVIHPKHPKRFKRIMAAIDPTSQETGQRKDKTDLNSLILQKASSLAEMEKGELHIVHAWRVYGETILKSPRFSRHAFDAIVEETRAQHERLTQDFVANHVPSTLRKSIRLIKGEAAVVIPEYVKTHDIDMVVMGTVSRTGIGGLLIGNTAEKILNQVECSVLTLKPKGFLTPVTLD